MKLSGIRASSVFAGLSEELSRYTKDVSFLQFNDDKKYIVDLLYNRVDGSNSKNLRIGIWDIWNDRIDIRTIMNEVDAVAI